MQPNKQEWLYFPIAHFFVSKNMNLQCSQIDISEAPNNWPN